MSWYFVTCFKGMETAKPEYGGMKCFHTEVRIAEPLRGLLRLIKCVPEDDLSKKRTFIVKNRSSGGYFLFINTYQSEFLYQYPITIDYRWFVQWWTNKTMTTLHEATSELKGMLDKCIMDDSVYIFENDLQPSILNHQLSSLSNRLIENTQTPSEFSIEFEGVITTKTFSPRRTMYDDLSHQQSNFNTTKDISSHKPEQVLNPYACHSKDCNKSFKKARHLKQHEDVVHTNEHPSKCDQCEKTFKHSQYLSQHKRHVHTETKLYKCKQCGKNFKYIQGLQRHQTSIHKSEQPHECNQCGEKFKTSHAVKQHQNLYHDETRSFECKQCGKRFQLHHHLTRHQTATHDNRRAHKCKHCSKSFSIPDDLKKHQSFVHNDERPYRCEQCGKKFKRSQYLKQHHQALSKHLLNSPNL